MYQGCQGIASIRVPTTREMGVSEKTRIGCLGVLGGVCSFYSSMSPDIHIPPWVDCWAACELAGEVRWIIAHAKPKTPVCVSQRLSWHVLVLI